MSDKKFLRAEEAKQLADTTEKVIARVFKQIKLEAEDGNKFTDIDMSRMSTECKGRITQILVDSGYKTLPLCKFYGEGSHGLRVYWENSSINHYEVDREYYLKNMLNADSARFNVENAANTYLCDILYQIDDESRQGNNQLTYDLHHCSSMKIIEDIQKELEDKRFDCKYQSDTLYIKW